MDDITVGFHLLRTSRCGQQQVLTVMNHLAAATGKFYQVDFYSQLEVQLWLSVRLEIRLN